MKGNPLGLTQRTFSDLEHIPRVNFLGSNRVDIEQKSSNGLKKSATKGRPTETMRTK